MLFEDKSSGRKKSGLLKYQLFVKSDMAAKQCKTLMLLIIIMDSQFCQIFLIIKWVAEGDTSDLHDSNVY